MSNPNPNQATRWQKGVKPAGSGRPSGSRDRISTAFLRELAEDFEAHGKSALVKVREGDPSTYLRVVASLQPKEIEVKAPLSGLDDGKLEQALEMLNALLLSKSAPPKEIEPISVSLN